MKSKILNFLRNLLFKKSGYKYSLFGINRFKYVYTQKNGLSHFFGTYENEIKEYIINKSKNSNLIFNIGAAYGYYASYFSKLSNNVVLFEPDRNSCNKLKELSQLINFDFKIINKFVSNFDDEDTISLNKSFEMYGIPDFIKVDIEGGEQILLDNSYVIIKEHKIRIIIELHSLEIENKILRDLKKFEIKYKVIDSYKYTREIRKVKYMKWLIIN